MSTLALETLPKTFASLVREGKPVRLTDKGKRLPVQRASYLGKERPECFKGWGPGCGPDGKSYAECSRRELLGTS